MQFITYVVCDIGHALKCYCNNQGHLDLEGLICVLYMSGCETFVGTSLPLVNFISRLIDVTSSIKSFWSCIIQKSNQLNRG